MNQKFLYSAFYGFTSQDTIDFFEESGLSTKTERGGRVFPVSDHSSDVIAALAKRMRQSKVKVFLNIEVKELLYRPWKEAAGTRRDGTETQDVSSASAACVWQTDRK